MSITATIAALALTGLLITASVTDYRARIIPNRLNLAVALLAPLWWWGLGWDLWPQVAFQVGLALTVGLILVPVFAIGQMGGGDLKLITALALWFPIQTFMHFLIAMSLFGLVITLFFFFAHRRRSTERFPGAPYGIAIALGGLVTLLPTLF